MTIRNILLTSAFGIAVIGGTAHAQTMSTTSSSYQAGYGLTYNQLQAAVDPSTRDSDGNRVIENGIMNGDNSVYNYSKSLGAGDSYSGAGSSTGATAIGNSLSVVVNGSYNTVIVNSTQTNNGNITATANGSSSDITGSVNLN
ncbi:MAG: holdfast anchoring protein HfaA [Asticcacaulis sp.]|uniref:holdfast anchoring protein HfaA n=1 Tax=Asticcacaulis sp. TaxID=1872648 RepID=UPI0039E2B9E5